jgi:hypothetical protein
MADFDAGLTYIPATPLMVRGPFESYFSSARCIVDSMNTYFDFLFAGRGGWTQSYAIIR